MESSNIKGSSVSKKKFAPRSNKNRRKGPGRRRSRTKTKAKKRGPKKEVIEEESSDGPMDHQLIERITLRNTMGDDIETLRGDLERLKERGSRFEGMTPSDEDKYEYGRRYTFDKDDIYQPRFNIPKRKIKAFKKNKEALMDMHRRDYERTKEKQLIKGNEVAPYPRPIEVEDDILQNSFMPEYLYIPEERLLMKDEEEQYREGMKLLYGDETPPELYKINERMIEEEIEDNSEDGYLHTPEERKELIDNYNKTHTLMVDKEVLKDELSDGGNIEEFYEKKIKYYENPSILGCMKLKEMLDNDPSLYQDKKFAATYITPCRDNKLLTEVFINNFDNVLPDFIMPPHVHIKDYLTAASESLDNRKKYPDGRKMYETKYFTPFILKTLLKILEEMGLYVFVDPFYFRGRDRFPGDKTYLITPCNSFHMLALNFKYMKKDKDVFVKRENISIEHNKYEAEGVYIKSLGVDGIDALKHVLDKLEEEYNFHTHLRGQEVDIEQTKRFFILLLMGVVPADSEYDEYYRKSIFILGDRIDRSASKAYTEIIRHRTGIPDIRDYNKVTNRNDGKLYKSELKDKDMAHYENTLQVYNFKRELLKDFKELHTTYLNRRDGRTGASSYTPEVYFDYYSY
tara:strand:- start:1342 stop:3225 length:1884 start_codon:yes stop_codon:yes gene_type:complete